MSIKTFGNPLLEKALDASWLRNDAISDNIANVDTPGYKRKDVKFQDYLKAAISKDTIAGIVNNPKHISINETIDNMKFKITKDYNTMSMRMDGNNVDIDVEMAELAKNQLLYNSYATLMNQHFGRLKSAIREGR